MGKTNKCYETTGEISDLIEAATDCLQFIKEDSVGYYYYWMLEALKKLNSTNNVTLLPDSRFKRKG